MDTLELARRVDALLPQAHCQRCGYADCRAYADAVAVGSTGIDRCSPGGQSTLVALAVLTRRPVKPLDPSCGEPWPARVARIDETRCIGCTLCIAACPVDAIIGAAKRMHSVLPSLCSGCALCVVPCPVDCIDLEVAVDWTQVDAAAARNRHDARLRRLATRGGVGRPTSRAAAAVERRRASVASALERARARRSANR
ncbi:MAG: RnfABCDGE type electron transport complex subunit B [Casimicrobiaceae bacterium]